MAIYWDYHPPQKSHTKHRLTTFVLATVTVALLYWSPLWVVPTSTGIALMLIVYMGMGFGVLVWAIKRVPIYTGRDPLPLGPLLVVMLYLGLVAASVLPLLAVIGSYNVQCYEGDGGQICTGYELKTDAQWHLEGQRAGDLPVMWVTSRSFGD